MISNFIIRTEFFFLIGFLMLIISLFLLFKGFRNRLFDLLLITDYIENIKALSGKANVSGKWHCELLEEGEAEPLTVDISLVAKGARTIGLAQNSKENIA